MKKGRAYFFCLFVSLSYPPPYPIYSPGSESYVHLLSSPCVITPPCLLPLEKHVNGIRTHPTITTPNIPPMENMKLWHTHSSLLFLCIYYLSDTTSLYPQFLLHSSTLFSIYLPLLQLFIIAILHKPGQQKQNKIVPKCSLKPQWVGENKQTKPRISPFSFCLPIPKLTFPLMGFRLFLAPRMNEPVF